MVTPVFSISDYSQALDFYIGWLGFSVDWEDKQKQGPVYLQVSRGEIVLHLTDYQGQSSPGAKARAEVYGLPSYHRQLLGKNYPTRPVLKPAYWNNRVLEMEVFDPFGNCLVFCELAILPM
ncbi:glyoxalase superfamily protein [Hymenobacter rubidus]|uniref:glyoxalase superfamily protein n=1 Tax=Hymenobacter rubidus TaxID=1441626 RepID=UPI00191F9923|nr:glyoxalase superfamily protein [Hymenobacter rubidus]